MIWDLITKWWFFIAIALYVVAVALAVGSARWSAYLLMAYLGLLMAGSLVACAKVFGGL